MQLDTPGMYGGSASHRVPGGSIINLSLTSALVDFTQLQQKEKNARRGFCAVSTASTNSFGTHCLWTSAPYSSSNTGPDAVSARLHSRNRPK